MSDEQPIDCVCECGRSFRVKAKAAGRTVKCPACARQVTVPDVTRPATVESFDFGAVATDDWPQPDSFNAPPALPAEPSPYASPLALQTSSRARAQPKARLPEFRKYRILELTVKGCRILAIIVFGLTLVFLVVSLMVAIAGGASSDVGVFGALVAWAFATVPVIFGCLVLCISLLMQAELIQLAIDVQSNTLTTARAAASQ